MSILIDQPSIGEFSLDTAGSTIQLTTDHAVAPNGFIVLAVQWVASGPTLSGVAGGGLTWAIDAQGTPSSSGIAWVSAQAPAGLGAGALLTATLSGSTTGARVLVGSSFTGVKPTSARDVAGTAQAVSAAKPWTTGNLTLQTGSVLVGLASGLTTDGTSAITAPSIETHDVTGGAGSYDFTTGYRIEPAGGVVAVAGAFSVNQTGGALGVAYLADPNPPGPAGDPSLQILAPIVHTGRFN